MYKSKMHNTKETQEILKNDSPNIFFKVYHKIKKRRGTTVKKPDDKLTLAELAKKIDNLGNDLRSEMNIGFKQVNSRIDRIETRLDYIVNANNLKDSK